MILLQYNTREYPREEGQSYKKVMLYDKEALKVIDYLQEDGINPYNFLSVH